MSSGSIATLAPLRCWALTQVSEAISTLAIANALGFTRHFMCSSKPPFQCVAIAHASGPSGNNRPADAASER
jgi:hypothetical protein